MRLLLLLLTLLTLSIQDVRAETEFDYSAFNLIPILDQGRIKPLGNFALHAQKRLSEDETNPSAWLSHILFDPATAAENFDLTVKNDQNVELQLLLRSFSLILPLNIQNKEYQARHFLDYWPKKQEIDARLKKIIAQKGENIDGYSENEQELALLSFQLAQIYAAGSVNESFKVIPEGWASGTKSEELTLISPWQIITAAGGSPKAQEALVLWEGLAAAYRNQDTESWNVISQQILELNTAHLNKDLNRLKLEYAYQHYNPYMAVYVLFSLSLILICVQAYRPQKWVFKSAVITSILATLTLIAAIGIRIYLLERPPVGTLYESVLFVALICAGLGLWFTRKGSAIPLFAGNISALGLLMMAPTLLMDGESLGVLSAVLNTSFWLGTHVLVITAGYGFCIITALFSHVYLYRSASLAHKSPEQMKLHEMTYHLSIIALLFTTIGTILGGIWADQSWGRFWGWDPKENGALLIVLWLIWIQHGRITGKLKPLGFHALSACLNIIVALAWFGVNLLNVGLHSYGFIEGIAWGLAIFCIGQTIIVIALALRVHLKKR